MAQLISDFSPSNSVKVMGSARQPILTRRGSAQGSISPGRKFEEIEVGRIVEKEEVQVKVCLLVKGVV